MDLPAAGASIRDGKGGAKEGAIADTAGAADADVAPPSHRLFSNPSTPPPPTPHPHTHTNRQITEPYLQIYRGILPPLFGQLDFTPLFGFLILQDVVEVMAPTYTMGLHVADTSTRWTTSDVMCYQDGF